MWSDVGRLEFDRGQGVRKLDGSVDASHQLVSDGRDGFLGVGLGVVSSAGERGTACGSQTSRTGFIWAAEATSLVAVAGVKARWAEARALNVPCRLAPLRRDECVGCHGRGGAVRGERWAPPRGAALTPPATPRTPLTLWGRHDRTRWSGGPSESPKRCSAGRWTRGWPKRAQSTEPIPGRPGRLARGPMVQRSCAWLERRRESSGGRRGREGGDAMRRGLIGGVERGGAKRRL